MQKLTYKEKFVQMNREARATWAVFALNFVVWFAGGLGIYWVWGSTPKLLGMPAWFTVGVIGSWVVTVGAVMYITKYVFTDFDLDDDTPAGEEA